MDVDGNTVIENLKLQRNAAMDALAIADAQRHSLGEELRALKKAAAKTDSGNNGPPPPPPSVDD